MNKATILAALGAALALAGCGGAPTDDEAKQALLMQMSAFGGKAGAKMFEEDMKNFKLTGCAKTDTGAYRCDFANGPMGAGTGRFGKTSDGWRFLGTGQ